MDDNLVGLALTNDYTGVVIMSKPVAEGVYDSLTKAKTPPPLHTWYFDAEEKGALWIASGGQHPEPVIVWLERSRALTGGASMLVAVLDNGGEIPSGRDVKQFRVPRKDLDAREMRALRESQHFVAYLPYTDDFLVLVARIGEWLSLSRTLNERTTKPIAMDLQDVPSGEPEDREHSGKDYDPIHSQISEVMGSVTAAAWTAAGELLQNWRDARLDVPDDVVSLQQEIVEEKRRVSDIVNNATRQSTRSQVLKTVDRYAQLLRARRRVMADLSVKLRDYQLNPEQPSSYERIATPLMLRALERYTGDVARRIGLASCVFVPVIGDDYATTPRPFPPLRPAAWSTAHRTAVVIEIPVDFRLRLGAMPMLAREVAGLKTKDVESIARRLVELRDHEQKAKVILPPMPETDGSAGAWNNYQQAVLDTARAIVTDLLACAAVGPQYVFALARFAVGTLGEPHVTGTSAGGARLELRSRLQNCLAFLDAIEKPARFTSIYLPEAAVTLPPELVDLVREATKEIVLPDDSAIDKVMQDLCAGRIVRANPTMVLAALWRGVVTPGRYVNEIAALVSTSAFD